MKALLVAVIVAFCFGANCAGCPPIPTVQDSGVVSTPDAPVVPTPTPDAFVITQDARVITFDAIVPTTPCGSYCQKLADLGCPEGTKYGVVTCTELCLQVATTGFAQLNLDCVKSISTKEAVRSVCKIKCQ